jgi:hypothetical protein
MPSVQTVEETENDYQDPGELRDKWNILKDFQVVRLRVKTQSRVTVH